MGAASGLQRGAPSVIATTVREVPVDPATAAKLRRAAAKIDRWTDERDRLIVQARAEGGTSREIAEMVGLTHAGVLKIVQRNQ